MLNKIAKFALIPCALGPLVMTGCATGTAETSTSPDQSPSGWTYVGSNSSGDAYFVDYGTIRRNGDYAKVAQKHVWRTPEIFCNGSSPAGSALFVAELNCRTEETRTLLSTAYSGPGLDGELVIGRDASSPWRRVVPGTPGARILEAVCK